MANVAIGGFRVYGTITGGEGVFPSPITSELASGYATGVFTGDIIIPVSDGTVAVGAAANNGLLMGVVVGCSYVTGGKRKPSPFVPASTTFSPTTVGSVNASYVSWVPLTGDVILEIDADDATTVTSIATAIAIIGENADLAAGAGGDTTTGQSTMLLDISTHATTTANFRVIGIKKTADNDVTAINAKYLVICNEGFLPPYTATGA